MVRLSSKLINQSGNYELLTTTLRGWFWQNYQDDSDAQKPKMVTFMSESGINNKAEHLSTNSMKYFEKEQSLIVQFAMGDTETLESWNDGVYQSQSILITIMGKHKWANKQHQMELIREKFDQILFDNHSETTLPKLNNENENSHFTGFLDFSIDWTREHEDNTGITEYIHGELHVSTQRFC